MNRKPVTRIALGAFALVSLLVISTSPLTAAWLIKSRASKIVNGRLPGLASSSLANINVSEGFVQLARSVHSADVPAQKRSLARLAETTQAVDRHYEVHRAALQTAEEREAFEQVMRRRAAYREVRQAVVALVEQGKGDEARRLFDDDCVPKFQAYLAALGGHRGSPRWRSQNGWRQNLASLPDHSRGPGLPAPVLFCLRLLRPVRDVFGKAEQRRDG